MKKNKMLRMASALLVLTLLTTSIIGGTFAKYTTASTSQDTARVAKWGVTISMSADKGFFKSTYKTDDTAKQTSLENSVVAATNNPSSTQDKVVAPGTTGSTTFTVAGTPEVAFELKVVVEITSTVKLNKNQDYMMQAKTFEAAEVKVQPTVDYEPIRFKLEKQGDNVDSWNELMLDATTGTIADRGTVKAENLTLEGLKTALESLTKEYPANTEVNATYKITWSWPFETPFDTYKSGPGYKSYENADVLDTYLGNLTDAQQEAYKIKITATQID